MIYNIFTTNLLYFYLICIKVLFKHFVHNAVFFYSDYYMLTVIIYLFYHFFILLFRQKGIDLKYKIC